MIAFENVKYSSKALKSKVIKEQIVKHVCEKYREDLGEMKLELFKNSGGYEDLIKDCCKQIEKLIPHGENELVIDKKQLVIEVFKILFPELTQLDEGNIARFISFIVGPNYKSSFSTVKWIWRRVKHVFCRRQATQKKTRKPTNGENRRQSTYTDVL